MLEVKEEDSHYFTLRAYGLGPDVSIFVSLHFPVFMRNLLLLFGCLVSWAAWAQPKTIHVYVALCDNVNQGIVPVPAKLGNGQQPANNLYWGALYGVKTHFGKQSEWVSVPVSNSADHEILDRVLYKHTTEEVYLLAEAYDGRAIQGCIEDFLRASNGASPLSIGVGDQTLSFGGGADLVAYVGHNGLMDFSVSLDYQPAKTAKDAMLLACYTQRYFSSDLRQAGANPLLWTTHLMAPEAYTLKAAIDGWLLGEPGEQIEERAAQAYHQYQQCGIRGARGLFTTGY